jgi:hypothetical protein
MDALEGYADLLKVWQARGARQKVLILSLCHFYDRQKFASRLQELGVPAVLEDSVAGGPRTSRLSEATIIPERVPSCTVKVLRHVATRCVIVMDASWPGMAKSLLLKHGLTVCFLLPGEYECGQFIGPRGEGARMGLALESRHRVWDTWQRDVKTFQGFQSYGSCCQEYTEGNDVRNLLQEVCKKQAVPREA